MSVRTQQFVSRTPGQWSPALPGSSSSGQLLIVFGSPGRLRETLQSGDLQGLFPEAIVVGCSTAGEIQDTSCFDDSIVVTEVSFDYTTVHAVRAQLNRAQESEEAGCDIARRLLAHRESLSHVLVLSDGLLVNGTGLVSGLRKSLPRNVSFTGGLAGDGSRFKETLVALGQDVGPGAIVAVGFYSDRLRVGCGSLGGWDVFGPARTITRSDQNKLYELDGRSALAIYKEYLGSYAAELPASALRFPLSIAIPGASEPVVRTILGIDEQEQSMTFAGDIPQGCKVHFMMANLERLVDGAIGAASLASGALKGLEPELVILVSCVGRRLVLKQRSEDELEAAREHLGPQAAMTGFYSYGEIAPFITNARCELHNQTMTITAFREDPQ